MKLIDERVMCTEKHVLVKKSVYKWTKHRFVTTSPSGKESTSSGNTLTLGKGKVFKGLAIKLF